jgi:soluble lytic murein transglycosylase-like protein
MRMRRILVGLALVAAGCGPMRKAGPPAAPASIPPPVTPGLAAPRLAPSEPDRGARELACVDHPWIDSWEQRMRSHRPLRVTAERALDRGEPYLPRLRAIMAEQGLPASLALLPAIESGFRAEARGNHGDVGMWQLRGPTARRFGLVVHASRDDRLDPFRATQAAARYLRYLHRRYRDWPFALAAYNAGEGRVDRARKRHPNASFWELADAGHLPNTSREFVPRFLALVRVSESRGLCRPAGAPGVQQARRDG